MATTLNKNTKCSKCSSKNVAPTGRVDYNCRYANGGEEWVCKDCGQIDLKGRAGRPKETGKLSKVFSDHGEDINTLTPKALGLLKKMMNDDVKGASPQQRLAAALKILDMARDLEKWQIEQGKLEPNTGTVSEEEGVQKPLISLHAPESTTLN